MARYDVIIRELFMHNMERFVSPTVTRDAVGAIVADLELGCRGLARAACMRTVVDPHMSRAGHALFVDTYSCYAYKVIDLLRDPRNELFDAIMSGTIRARDVARASIAQLSSVCPNFMRAEREDLELRRQQKIEQPTSSLYECKKCKERKTIASERQVRSSDESPTLMIQCLNCGHCWSQQS